MSLDWHDDSSEARKYALASAERTGEFNSKDPTWDIYCDLRYALVWSLLVTGFPARSPWRVTENNWRDVYRRLYILERVTGCKRVYNNGDKPSRKMYFTPEEIKSMIGLSTNVGNKSDAEFKKHIYNQLINEAEVKLQSFDSPLDEDPYYWEKHHAPDHIRKEKAS